MVTNNVTVYQFEVGLDEVFADVETLRNSVDHLIDHIANGILLLVVLYC